MIKLNKLNKFFFKNKKNEIHVLNDVNLELDSKGFVAIHGPSGSGKTTLLNVIGGLDKVNSGEIDFFGQKLSGYKAGVWDKIRNEHVGYIFQNYYLLPHLSVLDNIKFVLKLIGIKDEEYIESRVNYVLKAVGMYPFRKKKALQLSGGQQQRVAIARALVKNPKVIIADEPTGNLDSKNTIEIMNIIKEISKEKLVILVTHEKNLAEMYASRIINISDGKIVDDVINEESENHEVDDDAIYLKDIKNQEVIEKDNYKFNLYSDEEVKDLDIRLIVKNETLYLDVKGDFKNVKLADKSSGVTIKDAHYKKKTKEEVTKTTFDMLEIDHSKVEKDRKMLVSFKQTFMMAFEKLLTIGRKGKLMLFSFFIAGIILAFSTATFASVAVVRAEASMTLPKGYVIVEDNNKKFQEFKETLGGTDEKFYVNPFYNVDLKFINHNDDVIASQYGRFDINDHAKLYKLTKGKYAENNNEIVITSGLVEEFFSRGGAEDVGIWNINQLMKEKIRYADNYAQIVGVVESESKIIFASEMFAMANVFEGQTPYDAYDNLEILYGSAPNQDEVLVSDNLMKYMFGEDYNKDNFPETYTKPNGQLLKISGVHAHPDALEIYGFDELMRIFPLNNNVIGIYSSNSGKVIEGLKTHFNLKGEDYYQKTHDLIKRQRRVQLASSLVTTAFLVGFSLVGFYFVIRSSLIERLYEVAVFRALGVSKKEVLSSFLVEIFTITTITSFIGYTLTSYGLRKAQGGILGMFNVFYVNGLTYILGLILVYGLNLIAGLLPILILLRKTPAQILSDHDI